MAAALQILLLGCASSVIPPDWRSVPAAPRVEGLSYDRGGMLLYVPTERDRGGVSVETTSEGQRLVRGELKLTPFYRAIDSFDVSQSRGEVVFAAKRSDNFDIGLVSTDGSHVNWVPEDPADETGVQWAPRGNKVSFVIRGKTGDFVRTVHIPTSAQLTVGFPWSRVRALAWDPLAERYAVAADAPESSQRIETMKYDGEERRVVVEPSVQLDVTAEMIGGALVLRPSTLRYGEKLPLVVWQAEDPLAWDDARGELLRGARVACAVMREPAWDGLREVPWIDRERVFVVLSGAPTSSSATRRRAAGAPLRIVPDAGIPSDSCLRRGNDILVPPAVVKSFAARFIADRLKGSSPPHGSHR